MVRPGVRDGLANASWRRSAAIFSRSHPFIDLSQRGGVATRIENDSFHARGVPLTAASAVPMRSGRHYAAFTILRHRVRVHFGLIRPGYDVENRGYSYDVDGHCFYSARDGLRYPGAKAPETCPDFVERRDYYGGHPWPGNPLPGQGWPGSQDARRGDAIGLLLDLDTGTLTVFKNGERLGVMATGLEEEYCWAVSLGDEGDSVRIEPASRFPLPVAPTAAQVAAAVAFEAEQEALWVARHFDLRYCRA